MEGGRNSCGAAPKLMVVCMKELEAAADGTWTANVGGSKGCMVQVLQLGRSDVGDRE